MAIKGILFDKDGTLLDFYGTWMGVNWRLASHAAGDDEAAVEALMARGGLDLETGKIKGGTPLAWGSARDIAEVFAPDLEEAAFEVLVADYEAIFFEEAGRNATPVEGLKPTLEELNAKNFRLGIGTTDNEAGIEGTLGRFDVLPLFDFLAGCDSGYGLKPGPGMVLGFCAATGLAVEEVAVVGDNQHDMEMGRSAGAGLLVGVLTGASGHEDLAPHSHHVLPSIAGLPDLLKDLG